MLDETDLRILALLQQNAKLTIKELSDELHLTTSPIFERMKRLEKDGYIKGYVALINPEKVGRGQVVFCNVSMPVYTTENIEAFEKIVRPNAAGDGMLSFGRHGRLSAESARQRHQRIRHLPENLRRDPHGEGPQQHCGAA